MADASMNVQKSQVDFINQFVQDLKSLGVNPGGVLMVHSSLKSLRWVPGGAETVIQGLLTYLQAGTLLMPALSYETVDSTNPIFNLAMTPSCIGTIPEHFRRRPGTQRSLHPTHSVCGVGALAHEILSPHAIDQTPCGPNSPFRRLPDYDGQILMLGCGLLPNTSMHAIEELIEPPYLFAPAVDYQLTDGNNRTYTKRYTRHNFKGWRQRYDRIEALMNSPDLQSGDIALVIVDKINTPDTIAKEKLAQVKNDAVRENATREFSSALLHIKNHADIDINKRMLER